MRKLLLGTFLITSMFASSHMNVEAVLSLFNKCVKASELSGSGASSDVRSRAVSACREKISAQEKLDKAKPNHCSDRLKLQKIDARQKDAKSKTPFTVIVDSCTDTKGSEELKSAFIRVTSPNVSGRFSKTCKVGDSDFPRNVKVAVYDNSDGLPVVSICCSDNDKRCIGIKGKKIKQGGQGSRAKNPQASTLGSTQKDLKRKLSADVSKKRAAYNKKLDDAAKAKFKKPYKLLTKPQVEELGKSLYASQAKWKGYRSALEQGAKLYRKPFDDLSGSQQKAVATKVDKRFKFTAFDQIEAGLDGRRTAALAAQKTLEVKFFAGDRAAARDYYKSGDWKKSGTPTRVASANKAPVATQYAPKVVPSIPVVTPVTPGISTTAAAPAKVVAAVDNYCKSGCTPAKAVAVQKQVVAGLKAGKSGAAEFVRKHTLIGTPSNVNGASGRVNIRANASTRTPSDVGSELNSLGKLPGAKTPVPKIPTPPPDNYAGGYSGGYSGSGGSSSGSSSGGSSAFGGLLSGIGKFLGQKLAQQAQPKPPTPPKPPKPSCRVFTATELTIKPGESTTLQYAMVNSEYSAISPGVGRVDPHGGTVQVSPIVSTDYTYQAQNRYGTGICPPVHITVLADDDISEDNFDDGAVVSCSPNRVVPGASAIVLWQCPVGATTSIGSSTEYAEFDTFGKVEGSARVAPSETSKFVVRCRDDTNREVGRSSCRITVGEDFSGGGGTFGGGGATGEYDTRARAELKVDKRRVSSGDTVTISWEGFNTANCTITGPDNFEELGNKGSVTGRMLQTSTFELSCSANGRNVPKKSVTIQVI